MTTLRNEPIASPNSAATAAHTPLTIMIGGAGARRWSPERPDRRGVQPGVQAIEVGRRRLLRRAAAADGEAGHVDDLHLPDRTVLTVRPRGAERAAGGAEGSEDAAVVPAAGGVHLVGRDGQQRPALGGRDLERKRAVVLRGDADAAQDRLGDGAIADEADVDPGRLSGRGDGPRGRVVAEGPPRRPGR